MKVLTHGFDKTIPLYQDILGFEERELSSPDNFNSVAFKFGDKSLWIDKFAGIVRLKFG